MKLGPEIVRLSISVAINKLGSVLVYVTDTARLRASETLVPNDANGLKGQGVDLPSDIFIKVVDNGDWRSRINSRRRWWVDSRGIVWGQVAQRVLGGDD